MSVTKRIWKRQGRILPQLLQRKHGLALALISEFQTPELCNNIVPNHPICGVLLWQPQEMNAPRFYILEFIFTHCLIEWISFKSCFSRSFLSTLFHKVFACLRMFVYCPSYPRDNLACSQSLNHIFFPSDFSRCWSSVFWHWEGA